LGKGLKRFVKQASDAVRKHAEIFPYPMTYAEAEARKMRSNRNAYPDGE